MVDIREAAVTGQALTRDLHLLWPEFLLAITAFAILGVELLLPRRSRNVAAAGLLVLGLAGVGIVTFSLKGVLGVDL